MRALLPAFVASALAACTPAVPDSAAGVGFGNYNDYVRNAPPAVAPPSPVPVLPGSGFSPDSAAAAIDRATGVAPVQPVVPLPAAPAAPAPVTDARPRGNAPAGIKEETGEMAHINPSISDEQDFAAVSARETIESDKARIERNRAQYQVDQPGALPERSGDGGPNIVQFALSTSHPLGTQMYARSGIRLTSAEAACAKYGSSDLAQEAFLANGGPERDRKGIDPDGDGYACAWDPGPFRNVLQ